MGEDCASPLTTLRNKVSMEGQVSRVSKPFDSQSPPVVHRSHYFIVTQNDWEYYQISVPVGVTSLTVYLQETRSTGSVWVYVNQGGPPSLVCQAERVLYARSVYVAIMQVLSGWSETSTDSDQHVVYFRRDTTNSDQKFYIGVYGSPFITNDQQETYKLVVYYPPF